MEGGGGTDDGMDRGGLESGHSSPPAMPASRRVAAIMAESSAVELCEVVLGNRADVCSRSLCKTARLGNRECLPAAHRRGHLHDHGPFAGHVEDAGEKKVVNYVEAELGEESLQGGQGG